MKRGFLAQNGKKSRNTLQKAKKKWDAQQKRPNMGPLYPLRLFGDKESWYLGPDHILLISLVTFVLFLVPSFRKLPQAPLWKMFPIGTFAANVFLKRKEVPSYEDKAVVFSAIFALHSFGDSLLAQNDVDTLIPEGGTTKNMAISSLLFGFGWILYSLLVLTELPEEERKWSSLKTKTKCFIFGALAFGLTVVSWLLSRFEFTSSESLWGLLLVPYVVAEVVFLASALIAGDTLMIAGTLSYMMSDSLIALEDLVGGNFMLATWPLYYLGQWLLFVAGLRWLQTYNQNLAAQSTSMLDMLGVDTSTLDPKSQIKIQSKSEEPSTRTADDLDDELELERFD
eukprot:TRINITY_DN4401_c0_g1_i2.p1 TRINITY_DN4401_c0_g1~~TRINITY_DN4401_c0_g1_i2.p1  ORF type:complete len:340 (-),score=91.51 TRINITY_DN4401_c0_g1_i2:41-1060(-)